MQKIINLKEIDESDLPDDCENLEELIENAEELREALELEICKILLFCSFNLVDKLLRLM